ncbi:MAG: hypothetical protein AAF850_08710 [Pseudomonadota bacterium]
MTVIYAACSFAAVSALLIYLNAALVAVATAVSKVSSDDVRVFSPKRTVFILGPDASDQTCRIQRRFLKPVLAAFIRDEIAVVEAYGDDAVRRNGEPMGWPDAMLVRHALGAGEEFALILMDDDGRVAFRSERPVVGEEVLKRSMRLSRAGLANRSEQRRRLQLKPQIRAAA